MPGLDVSRDSRAPESLRLHRTVAFKWLMFTGLAMPVDAEMTAHSWTRPSRTKRYYMTKPIMAEELPDLVGKELAPSPWIEITQERVNQFAAATNDHQFIHVDPEKAAATPFGGPIAHGFLSLSLLSYLNAQSGVVPEDVVMGINYGSDKVRYLMPVRVGKRIRSRQKVLEVSEKKPGQWLMKTAVTVEIEDEDTPALVAEILSMMVVGS